MSYYLALIDETDGAIGVAIPDCPGCTAMGTNFEDALRNATDALAEWMADRKADGFDAPEARSFNDLRNDPHLAPDFHANPIVAGVPLLMDAGRSVRANISLDAGLLAAIDEAARRHGVTRSSFLASAARSKIASDG